MHTSMNLHPVTNFEKRQKFMNACVQTIQRTAFKRCKVPPSLPLADFHMTFFFATSSLPQITSQETGTATLAVRGNLSS